MAWPVLLFAASCGRIAGREQGFTNKTENRKNCGAFPQFFRFLPQNQQLCGCAALCNDGNQEHHARGGHIGVHVVGDLDGIVVIRPQDAEEVLAAAVKKKASEDKVFELMAQDVNAYATKHLGTTEKRKQGKNIDELKSWSDIYA